MKHLIVLIGLLTAAVASQAQGVLLSAGQSFDYTFTSLPFIGPADVVPDEPAELYQVWLTWAQGTFESGSLATISLFENSTAETPFRTADLQGYTPPPPQPGDPVIIVGGIGILGRAGSDSPAWQGLQGVLRVSVTAGSIVVSSFGCETVADGIRYGGPAPIPEPR